MGVLNEHVYSNNRQTLQDLQESIRHEIVNIGAVPLVKVFRNLEQRRRETGLTHWEQGRSHRKISTITSPSFVCIVFCILTGWQILYKRNPKIFSTITQGLMKFRSLLQKLFQKQTWWLKKHPVRRFYEPVQNRKIQPFLLKAVGMSFLFDLTFGLTGAFWHLTWQLFHGIIINFDLTLSP